MTLAGRMHPLLVHFPIALVLVAALAELASTISRRMAWRALAIANLRAGALFAAVAAIAGWIFAASPGIDASPTLEWHRWLGTVAAIGAAGAALTTPRAATGSARALWIYRITLFGTAAAVAGTGHVGAILVWGADFLRP